MNTSPLTAKTIIVMIVLALPGVSMAQPLSWQSLNGPESGRFVLTLGQDADGHTFVSTYVPSAVYRSSDDGATWEKTGLIGQDVYSICSGNDGMIFAAAFESILRSSDHGMQWEAVTQSQDSLNVTNLCTNPRGIIFAAGWYMGVIRSSDNGNSWYPSGLKGHTEVTALATDKVGTLFAATSDSGAYRSTDDGASWQTLDSLRVRVSSFGVNAHNEVFAGAYNGLIYRSVDSGQSWERTGSGLPTYTSVRPILTCAPFDTIWAGTVSHGIFRSIDGGVTFERAKRFFPFMDVKALLRTDDGTILTGVFRGGVFRSTNGGGSWSTSGKGLGFQPITSVVTDAQGNTFAGCDAGVFINRTGAISWQNAAGADTAVSPFAVESFTVDSSHNLHAGSVQCVFRTGDLGQIWSFRSVKGGATTMITAPTKTVFAAVNYYEILYDYHGTIIRSVDNGDTWNTVYENRRSFTSLAESPDGTLYAASDPGVVISGDDGLSWHSTEIGGWQTTRAVTAHQNDFVLACTDDSLYRTTDAGRTWHALRASPAKLRVLLSLGDGVLYAGSSNRGVLRSTDLGLTWTEENTGMTDTTILAIALGPDNRLVCGTQSNGVFRSEEPVVSVPDRFPEMNVFALAQNYPNPFNPTTAISYQLSAVSNVRLAVFDMLGREVSVLVNGREEPGVHEVKFDGSSLASGVYIYRLTAGTFSQTRKLVLIR